MSQAGFAFEDFPMPSLLGSTELSNYAQDLMRGIPIPSDENNEIAGPLILYGGMTSDGSRIADATDTRGAMTAEQIREVLKNASGMRFTSAAENHNNREQPDFFLSEDGKLIANPDKSPSADGSINIEVQNKNQQQEIDSKKLADQLQKASIKELISYFLQNNPEGKIPQDWLDILNREPDLPASPLQIFSPDSPAVPAFESPQTRPPQAQPEYDNSSSGSTAPPAGGGYPGGDMSGGSGGGGSTASGGGYSGGGGGSDYSGGGGSSSGTDVTGGGPDIPAPTGESGMNVSAGDGKGLEHLKEAIQRASSGGQPVSVLQYGDSHIVEGTEAKTIEALLKGIAPTEYHTQAKGGITAQYPLDHPQDWLDKPISQTNPDLVILSFGSNDAAGPKNPEQYAQTYQKLIDEVRERAPNASILVVGPSDGNSISGANKGNDLPGLETVIQVQREVAARNGLDFFDLREAMGGAGSIEKWHADGLAAGDELHFTKAGYQKLGQGIFEHIKSELA